MTVTHHNVTLWLQRVLSSKTGRRAQLLSYGGGIIALIMTGPSVLFGAIAKVKIFHGSCKNIIYKFSGQATDWSKTDYPYPAPTGDCAKIVLPLTLQYLTPKAVAFFGLGAVMKLNG